MQKLAVLIVAFGLCFSCIAGSDSDSLWRIWYDTVLPDTNRLDAIRQIIWNHYLYTKRDSALDLAQQQYELALKTNNKKYMASALNTQGIALSNSGYFKRALDVFKKKLEINEEDGNLKGVGNSYVNMALIYYDQGNYKVALDYLQNGLSIYEELNNETGIAYALGNIGLVYEKQLRYEDALQCYRTNLKINEELGDQRGMAYAYNNIGNLLSLQSRFDSAVYYFEKSLDHFAEIGDIDGKAYAIGNIGNTYMNQGSFETSLPYSEKALMLSQQMGSLFQINKYSQLLYRAYKELGNLEAALEMNELYVESKDSLYKIEGKEEALRFYMQREYDLLKQADSIKHHDEIIIHKAQTKAKEEQLKHERTFRFAWIGGFVLIAVSLYIVIKQLNKTKAQKRLVEIKQQEIADSIDYAKKIQDALMTSELYIKTVLKDSFLFYKPKDVVSGDFYWAYQTSSGHIFFTVADCTGHGVPGAFMSMIGTALLNENIIENGVEDPAQVLNNIREQIIKALKQEEQGESMDGMNMALCKLDPKKRTLEFAGAFNPVIHIRDDELTQIDADSQPVALYTGKKTPFSNQIIQLKKGDMLYVFSDGFADQFGGKKDKKYLRSNFYNFLLSISAAPTQQQQQAMETEFDSWKGDNEQIDDVCVMGVRV